MTTLARFLHRRSPGDSAELAIRREAGTAILMADGESLLVVTRCGRFSRGCSRLAYELRRRCRVDACARFAFVALCGIALAWGATGCASSAPPPAAAPSDPPIGSSGLDSRPYTAALEQLDDDARDMLWSECGGSYADVGKVALQSTSYPCEILRTYAAIEATRGHGFWMGTLPRFFLRARLVSKGLFSTIFGSVGLG